MQSNLRRNSLKTKKSGTHKVTHFFEGLSRNLVGTSHQSRLTSHGLLADTKVSREAQSFERQETAT